MSKKFSKKPLMLAMGAAFALSGTAAHASLFQVADLGTGYMVAEAAKSEGDKKGEVKCGAECVKAKAGEGMKEADAKAACDKMAKEGKCGGDKKKEGKCGEGKCGGKK
jgi:uncharacterized low-complexity protein